eukprot:7423896-Pyramimonas_sp.AAC.1
MFGMPQPRNFQIHAARARRRTPRAFSLRVAGNTCSGWHTEYMKIIKAPDHAPNYIMSLASGGRQFQDRAWNAVHALHDSGNLKFMDMQPGESDKATKA